MGGRRNLTPTPRNFECRAGDRTARALAAIDNNLPNFVIYNYFYIYYRCFSHKIDANSKFVSLDSDKFNIISLAIFASLTFLLLIIHLLIKIV